jgi:subtilisin family serine protease
MVDYPNIVITPEVESMMERSEAAGNRPIPVIIAPSEDLTAEEVLNHLREAGIIEEPERTGSFIFAVLPPERIRRVAASGVVKRIWLDHEIYPQVADSLSTIQADPASIGLNLSEGCADVTWAVLDDGIDAGHPALGDCHVETVNFTQDPDTAGGHGTHIAGIIGGHAPNQSFYGVAPQCHLLNYKVLSRSSPTNASVTIKALERIRLENERAGRLVIHGANLSLGYLNPDNFKVFSPGHSPLCEEVNRLVSSGVFVAVSAGNFGAQAYLAGDGNPQPIYAMATIADPGTAELATTVGSTHKIYPNRYGVSVFSSKGPTGDGRRKPDLLAPGEKIRSCVPGGGYLEQSGTSQAAAFVSGIAAFLLHRHPNLIGQPQTVKDILVRSCRDLQRDRNFQGQGIVNLAASLQLSVDRSDV